MRTGIKTVAATAITLGVIIGGGGIAQANTADTHYKGTENRLTLWDDDHYQDRSVVIQDADVEDLGAAPYHFNNKASSYVNKTSRYILVSDATGNYQFSDQVCLKPHSHGNNLDAVDFGDAASSLIILGQDSTHCGFAPIVGATNV